jgi:hypothetical protein
VAKVTDVSETLVMPAAWSRQPDEQERRRREEILFAFDEIFAEGFVAVSCDLESDEQAVYSFEMLGAP